MDPAAPPPALNGLLDAVRELRAAGFGVCRILPGAKLPNYRGWTLASLEVEHFTNFPNANVGILGGTLSGNLWVVDFDRPELREAALSALPSTMVDGRVSTGPSHYYYRVTNVPGWATAGVNVAAGLGGPRILHVRDKDKKPIGLDIIGTGGQVVCPPSLHYSGERRIWFSGPDRITTLPLLELWATIKSLAVRFGAHFGGKAETTYSCPPPEEKPAPKSRAGSKTHGSGKPRAGDLTARVVAYLAKCPPAITGQGGHGTAFEVVRAVVWGFDVGPDVGFDLIAQHYNPRCEPPWNDAELRHKCREADTVPFSKPRGYLRDADREPGRNGAGHAGGNGRHGTDGKASVGDFDGARLHQTDRGNAIRLVRRHGANLRFCHPWGKWLAWDGQRWRADDTAQAMRWAKETVVDEFGKASQQLGEIEDALKKTDAGAADPNLGKKLERAKKVLTWCLKSEDVRRLKAMVDLARSDLPLPIVPAELNRHRLLLNCPNGTLDLATGRLRNHDRGDCLTQLCPTAYDPAAICPTWETFLHSVFAADVELILFLQRVCGLMLTGDAREHILLIFWGGGANGKSTLVNALLELLGWDYAIKAPPDLLMARRGESHPTERADLYARRLVVCSETPQGRCLNEAMVKDMTGGEPIRARRMREDFWQFEPTHKTVLCTNHRPVILGTDEGIWRRLRLVPFEVTFWDPAAPAKKGQFNDARLQQDKQLAAKLRGELPGILAWCVRGCLDWQRLGLTLPEKVRLATNQYRSDEDMLGQFLAEKCVVGPDYCCKASGLYKTYVAWSEGSGEKPSPQKTFGEALTKRGFARYTSNGTWYRGLAISSSEEVGQKVPSDDRGDAREADE
jgi:P4 family phage/plasmid primase-like protien